MFSPVLVSSNVMCFEAEASYGMSCSDWRSEATARAKPAALAPAEPPSSGVGVDFGTGRQAVEFQDAE